MNDNPRTRRRFVYLFVASLVIFLVAGGALVYLQPLPFQTAATTPHPEGSPPPFVITPPASLDDLANRYPEIANLLRDPAIGSAYKEILIAYQQGGLSAAEATARDRGFLAPDRSIRVTLVLDSPDSAPAVTAELVKFGVRVEGTYQNLIDIAVPWSLVEQFAKTDNPGKLFGQLSSTQHIVKLRLPQPIHTKGRIVPNEGIGAAGALAWQQAGFTGKGVKIGVLDLGFDGYQKLLGTALPSHVTIQSFVPGQEPDQTGEIHGTACAEIVHEMAPDADLYLAYYSRTTQMAAAVKWLEQQGVQIITHSAGSDFGPMDGTEIDAQIVDQAASLGILWVVAAGNEAQTHYRFTFRDGGNGNHLFPNNRKVMGYIPSPDGVEIALNWDDWTGAASEDYDLYLYDDTGKLVASSEDVQGGSPGDEPAEGIIVDQPASKQYYIAIVAKHITRPAVFDLITEGGELEFNDPDHSLDTPADARGAFTIGAIGWNKKALEPFSSQGPTNDNRHKPEVIAPDGVTSAVYSPDVFFGTSAATPHVAGAAALVKSRFPQATTGQIEAFLMSYSSKMAGCALDACGAGRLLLPPPAEAVLPGAAQTPVAASNTPTAIALIPTLPPILTLPPIAVPSAIAVPSPIAPPIGVPSPPIGVPSPIAPPVPLPPSSNVPSPRAAAVLVGCLSLLTCFGALGSTVGVLGLFVLARPKAQPAAPSAPADRIPAKPEEALATAPAGPELRWTGAPVLAGAGGRQFPAGGRQFPLRLGVNSVGRMDTNALYLDDPKVSRHHAELAWDGVNCTATDLGSANGTLVNNKRLPPNQPQRLRPGDRIAFGPNNVWTIRSET